MMRPLVLYRGPSAFDPSTPIIVYGKNYDSDKMGGGVLGLTVVPEPLLTQFAGDWTMLMRAGADEAVCGACPRRAPASGGDGSCYVRMGRTGMGIATVTKGNINLLVEGEVVSPGQLRWAIATQGLSTLRSAVWGDMAAVPEPAWQRLYADYFAPSGAELIGYTHAWRTALHLQGTHMASCDSPAEHDEAKQLGWRTFTVEEPGAPPPPAGSGYCPSSKEWAAMGRRVVPCSVCQLCSGLALPNGRDVRIWDHAKPTKRTFKAALKTLSISRRQEVSCL